ESPAGHENMSDKAQQPMAPGDHEDMKASAHEQESTASHEPMRAGQPPGSYVAPSRAGMKRVQGYFSPRVKRQLRLLAVNADVSEEELVGRALDLLFRAEGLPEIAFDGKERSGAGAGEEP
ncbi:MAG: ribbon-helix-helix domain-containing protein, partial [bacterium]